MRDATKMTNATIMLDRVRNMFRSVPRERLDVADVMEEIVEAVQLERARMEGVMYERMKISDNLVFAMRTLLDNYAKTRYGIITGEHELTKGE